MTRRKEGTATAAHKVAQVLIYHSLFFANDSFGANFNSLFYDHEYMKEAVKRCNPLKEKSLCNVRGVNRELNLMWRRERPKKWRI